ncbi:hypothetical protein XA26_10640 [Mycolicibacterium fortuitum]|uniref:Uncharacterized protein n=5 Tax=Actinomycetes TaxID=1760 RepID=A0A0N9XN99_MYCFO|nr:hypothetical protein G155_05495 [Mycobacterium sp. VKM Ac-1817D]ALI24921.1 hypothetical protein XA26_10640 [Mycolicibacterium fortuitum]EJZ05646.1 hypothetical protein MFORT_29484 [Mycolicibacterium fortuitum subsp. fortuitum DSM 46621 = ATCC 6841 = JCM 6387]CRL80308.1 hypothetical protein CPGR_03506 [Mycolicibacter nonchromogenicus]BDD97033.1 hypothetical protein MFTT_11270 [Mycolicibacterium fortuitum subsp. fortuitum]GAT01423.1 uncharacterized protein RMCFA_1537 [Mycolicibacterium fortui
MKMLVVGAGAAAATGAAVSLLFGAGVAAAAPDVVGQTYSDASSAIEDSGSSAKVAVTVGSKLSQGDCIVTNAWDAPFVRDGSHASGEVMVALNCDGAHATANHPGASVASPAGREAKAADDLEAAKQAYAEQQAQLAEQEELAEASTPDE